MLFVLRRCDPGNLAHLPPAQIATLKGGRQGRQTQQRAGSTDKLIGFGPGQTHDSDRILDDTAALGLEMKLSLLDGQQGQAQTPQACIQLAPQGPGSLAKLRFRQP
jgi:hypothetical protein